MALGLSGSNSGIGEVYRKFVIADVDAGVLKYQTLAKQVDEKYKPFFENTANELKGLLQKLKGE